MHEFDIIAQCIWGRIHIKQLQYFDTFSNIFIIHTFYWRMFVLIEMLLFVLVLFCVYVLCFDLCCVVGFFG